MVFHKLNTSTMAERSMTRSNHWSVVSLLVYDIMEVMASLLCLTRIALALYEKLIDKFVVYRSIIYAGVSWVTYFEVGSALWWVSDVWTGTREID